MQVRNFFQSRSVFITGGTGFLGKVLVEKLLRSCSGLDKVYLLIRSDGKSSAGQRLLDMKSKSQLFDRIRSECPAVLDKLVALDGDVTLSGLGLSAQHERTIVQNASAVFHTAATVRFNAPLRTATAVNVQGTVNVTELAKKMEQLKAFVHVSSAYANCNRKHVDEMLYPTEISPEKLLQTVRLHNNHDLVRMTPDLLGSHPNTYTFSKHLTEAYLGEHCKELPLVITRPAVISPSWKEPFPGWGDSKLAATGIFIKVGEGVLRTINFSGSKVTEFIPVDLSVNHMIVAAWDVATRELQGPLVRLLRRYPTGKACRYPKATFTGSKTLYKVKFFLEDFLFAALRDACLLATGRRPRALSHCTKMYYSLKEHAFYNDLDNVFSCHNVLHLQGRLTEKDREEFNLSVEGLNWDSYMESYVKGIRRWALREDDETLEDSRRKIRRLRLGGQLATASVFATLGYWLWHCGHVQVLASLVY